MRLSGTRCLRQALFEVVVSKQLWYAEAAISEQIAWLFLDHINGSGAGLTVASAEITSPLPLGSPLPVPVGCQSSASRYSLPGVISAFSYNHPIGPALSLQLVTTRAAAEGMRERLDRWRILYSCCGSPE